MKQFTLEYWTDDGWYVGRLKEMPAVMSQGETLEELQAMIRDAYHLIVGDASENTFVPSETIRASFKASAQANPIDIARTILIVGQLRALAIWMSAAKSVYRRMDSSLISRKLAAS